MSNAETAARIVEAIPSGVIEASLLHPRFHAWTITRGDMTGEEYGVALQTLAGLFDPPLHVEVIGVTDGGERIAVEARSHGTLPDGTAYANSYHFLLAFEDGLLVEIREYLDTASVAAVRAAVAARQRTPAGDGASE